MFKAVKDNIIQNLHPQCGIYSRLKYYIIQTVTDYNNQGLIKIFFKEQISVYSRIIS